jgi:hypothetical protein
MRFEKTSHTSFPWSRCCRDDDGLIVTTTTQHKSGGDLEILQIAEIAIRCAGEIYFSLNVAS